MTEQHTHEVAVKTDREGNETRTETRTENGATVEHKVEHSAEKDGEPQQLHPEGR